MSKKSALQNRIRGWIPQEPKLSNRQVNILSSIGNHSYRNFRVLSRVAILVAAIPVLALIWFSNINPLIRFVCQVAIISVVIVLSAMADRYGKRKYLQKEI